MKKRLSVRRKITNFVMLGGTGVCTLLVLAILFYLLAYLLVQGGSALNWRFFTSLPAPVGETDGGMANAIVGSVKILFLAALIGIPIGFLAGVYLSEYGDTLFSSVVRFVADLLNGIPSIVMGILAYTLLVIKMRHFSAIAGSVALGVMMIPIIMRSTEAFLRAVPDSLREGAMALGVPKWKALSTVVVPAAFRGIAAGMMLTLARVAGETAPLLFTSLNNQFWSPGLNQPTATLPVMIYTYAISPYPDWHRQAWAAGFVLLGLVLSVNMAARILLSPGAVCK